MTKRSDAPKQRPTVAEVIKHLEDNMMPLSAETIRDLALRSEAAPKLCSDCGCELECVKHGCAKKYDASRNNVLEAAAKHLERCPAQDGIALGYALAAESLRSLKTADPQEHSTDYRGRITTNTSADRPAELAPSAQPCVAVAPSEEMQLMARRYLETGELGSERVAYDLAHEILRCGERPMPREKT